MLKRIIVLLFGLVVFSSCAKEASIYKVLSDPDQFVGKEVSLKGYLIKDTFISLYPYEIDANIMRLSHQIIIDGVDFKIALDDISCYESYVKVVGTVFSIEPVVLTDIRMIKKINLNEKVSFSSCWKPN